MESYMKQNYIVTWFQVVMELMRKSPNEIYQRETNNCEAISADAQFKFAFCYLPQFTLAVTMLLYIVQQCRLQ